MPTPKKLFAAAGFGHIPWLRLVLLITACNLIISLIAYHAIGLVGVAVAVWILLMGGQVEILSMLADARSRALNKAIPEVAESVASGVASGQELGQCLSLLAVHGPKALKKSFGQFNELIEQGHRLESALAWLQIELSNVYGDQLVQLLLVSLRSGGSGLVANLTTLSTDVRLQGSLDAELRAKQGWVSGTAKLGVLAPWLIVLFLNARPEAHVFYSSLSGFNLMVVGLVVCLLAYLLIQFMSKLPTPRRVFIDV